MSRTTPGRPLHGWLAAQAVSLTGTRVSLIALPLFVLETTGSATRTGLVAMAEALPLVFTKILGGPVIDRIGARRVAITCDLGSVVAVGLVPLLHALGLLSFGALLGLVAVAGALRGPGDGALASMVPALVTESGVAMERATGLEGFVERSASLLGAAMGGLTVALIGAPGALVLDAASFGVAAALLTWSTAGLGRPAPLQTPSTASYRRELREGWDFLVHEPVLRGITVMVSLTNLLDAAYVAVLLPVWAIETGRGATGVALLLGVFSGCSAIGAAAAATWGARLPRFKLYLVAFLITSAPRYVVMALDSPLAAVLAIFAVAGLFSGVINPILGAVTFERIPPALVGRVTSLENALCYSLIPLGGLLGGLAVTGAGLTWTLLVSGAVYLTITMLPAVDRRWRDLDHRPQPVEVSVTA